MNFLSAPFLLFFPIVFFSYALIEKKHKYLFLLIANYIFYGWNNFNALLVLILSTILSFIGGILIERYKKSGKQAQLVYFIFFIANLSILFFFKYTNFFLYNIGKLFSLLPGRFSLTSVPQLNIFVPIGLSFFIFQSSSYLNDVYRKGQFAERNFLCYAAFVSFFPSILSGPIQRSRDLLPQLRNPQSFQFDQARDGFLLLIWGCFQKIVISSQFCAIVDTVFNSYTMYDHIQYILAACCYSLYIYCDFSSYSDMACGIAQMLGFKIHPNFRNPYLAETLTDFWNRWHISLNSWFVENIYIPLGGNRKGTFRKYLNVIIVFAISGIWHGAGWNFIAWGLLNGILRIAGEILVPAKARLYRKLNIDVSLPSIRFLRRLGVFICITITWVFFRMPDLTSALHVVKNMLFFHPASLFAVDIFELLGSAKDAVSLLLSMLLFISVQNFRKEEGRFTRVFSQQPLFIQVILLAVMICFCIFGICSETTTLNTQFIYFQF